MRELPELQAWILAITGAAVIIIMFTSPGRKLLTKHERAGFPLVAISSILGIQALVWGGSALLGAGALMA